VRYDPYYFYTQDDFMSTFLIIFSAILVLLFLYYAVLRKKSVDSSINSSKDFDKTSLSLEVPFSIKVKSALSPSNLIAKSKIFFQLGSKISAEEKDHLEQIFYESDMSTLLIEELFRGLDTKGDHAIQLKLQETLFSQLNPIQENGIVTSPLFADFKWAKKPSTLQVILFVGVNGVGKTTTVGKIAAHLGEKNRKVVVGAADTFRAAAVDQLAVWCQRANAELVSLTGGDPAAVAYKTVEKAIALGANYCLIDTAGRLQNNSNLMDEVGKIRRVLDKFGIGAPHEVILVVDSMTGQNALSQARHFDKAMGGLTSIIATKCDGSSKAGTIASIMYELKKPILMIGVGEQLKDLGLFDVGDYVSGILGKGE
jgi:fused signal recognition particle receptor